MFRIHLHSAMRCLYWFYCLPLLHTSSFVIFKTIGGAKWIFVISSFPPFSRSSNQIFVVSKSYHVDLENPGQLLVLQVYSIVYWLRFWGQVIHFSQFHKAIPCSSDLKKFRSTSDFKGTRGYWWSWLGLGLFHHCRILSSVFKLVNHVLSYLLQSKPSSGYELRPRAHNYVLPDNSTHLADCNFINRVLYRNTF